MYLIMFYVIFLIDLILLENIIILYALSYRSGNSELLKMIKHLFCNYVNL